MLLPTMELPDKWIGHVLVAHLAEKYSADTGLHRVATTVGTKLSWSLDWHRENPDDGVLAEAANILISRP